MGILRNAFIGVIGKKTQTLIIFVIILLILLFEIIGLLIHSAFYAAEQDTYRQIGVSIEITKNTNEQNDGQAIITPEMMKNLLNKKHVVGFDSTLETYQTPVNFKNTKLYSGINPATQNDNASLLLDEIKRKKDQISLSGGINTKYNNRFYKNQNVLVEGIFPDQNHEGAIISEQLFRENNLEIGEIISLKNDNLDITVNIEIIGVYRTNLSFEILENNLFGEGVFCSSPYNTIYTNYDTVNSLLGNTNPLINLTVWVDAPQNIQILMDEINEDRTWDGFTVYNLTGLIYNDYAQQLVAMGKMSNQLINLSLLLGGIILIIVMTFFANSYMYEIALYNELGMKLSRILLIQFIQAFMIVFAAMKVSLLLSPLIIYILNYVIKVNYIYILSDATLYSYYTGDMDIQNNFYVSMTPDIFIGIGVVVCVLTVISVVIPFLAVKCIKPRDILIGKMKGYNK